MVTNIMLSRIYLQNLPFRFVVIPNLPELNLFFRIYNPKAFCSGFIIPNPTLLIKLRLHLSNLVQQKIHFIV